MRVELKGVYLSGRSVIATTQDFEMTVTGSKRAASLWDRTKEEHGDWRGLLEAWLNGFWEWECSSERLGEVVMDAFASWVRSVPRPLLAPAVALDFNEPPSCVRLSAKERYDQILAEFSAGTLLFKTGVRWPEAFSESTEAPTGQKLPSASLIVRRPGPTHLFSGGGGALYSGLFSTVYTSSGGDMQSGDFSVTRWREIIATRSEHLKDSGSDIATNQAMLADAKRGGMSAHNEVLAVLRPSSLLGMFFVSASSKGRRGVNGMLASAKDQRQYLELVDLQHTYPLAKDLPILQFDPERTRFL